MRILMLTDRFPPEVRSAAHLFHDLAREFHRRGHDIVVITKAPRYYIADGGTRSVGPGWADVDGVRTLRVRGFPLAGQHPVVRALDHLTLGWSFGRASRQWPSADIVLVSSPPLPLAGAGLAYQREFGASFVLNVQDPYPQTAIDLKLLRNRIAIAMAERMERRAYESAARIVVHSPGNRAFLLERKNVPGRKVLVVYNWADTDAFRPGPRDNGFRREHGLGGKFVVSYAGLMGYAQDLSSVINCAVLMKDDTEVLFLLVGEGVLENRWKKMASDLGLNNVRFLPMQPRDRYAQLLAASDVCLVPLHGDLRTPVVPGKLQSIMASGRPAITIVEPGGDTPKLLAESGAGVNVPPGQPMALASAIRRLKENPALREEMGRSGRAYAESYFSVEKCAEAYEKLFLEIFEERRTSRSMSDIVQRRSSVGYRLKQPFLKRPLDIFLSSAGLILSAPLWILIAALIKLDDGGSIFYGQERVGRGGRRFKSWKFRSMVPDSDEKFGPLQARDRDTRVTRVGQFLRATAMDELPQLWNIFKGDMSFVGPRSLLPEEIEVNGRGELIPLEKIPGYVARHRVRPGLTGLAQVYAPRDIPRRHKFKLDLLYIRKQSFWLDLRLIALSFWITFRGKWEHRGTKL